MSILNVNQIQPVGGGNTITVNASDVSASGVTITASSFVGPVTGNVTGNLTGNVTGNVTSSSTSTFSSGINVTGGRVLIGTTNAGSNGTADDLVVANNGSASDQAGITIRGGTSGRSQIFFSDGTSGQDEYRGMLRYDHSENSMQFRTAATERLRITSAGLVGVNCTPLSQLQVKTATNANIALTADGSEASIEAFNDAGSANVPLRIRGSQIKFKIDGTQRARLSYSSSSAVFSLGDESNSAGHLRFEAKASENQIHGRSNHPITFLINTAEKLRITSGGNLSITDGNLVVASGHGIDFSATADGSGTNTSELLDDYETGNWTPVLKSGTNVITVTGSQNYYRYIKVGRLVRLFYSINNATTSGTTGGTCTIGGLPFTPSSSTTNNRFINGDVMFYNSGFKLSNWPAYVHHATGDGYVNFYHKASAGDAYGGASVGTVGASSYFFWTFTYYTD